MASEVYNILEKHSSDPSQLTLLLIFFADDKATLARIFSYACIHENVSILLSLRQFVPEIATMIMKMRCGILRSTNEDFAHRIVFTAIKIGEKIPEIEKVFDTVYCDSFVISDEVPLSKKKYKSASPPLLPGEKMEDVD